MLRTYCLTFLLLACCSESFAAHLPHCEKELPIFPAAIRDRNLEAVLRAAEPEHPSVPDWEAATAGKHSSTHLALFTGMPPEEVFKFYRQMFGVVVGEDAPAPPLEQLSFHDHGSFSDCYDEQGIKILAGEKARADMEKNRKPFKSGKWLKDANFSWVVQEDNGELSELTLKIQDVSFICRNNSNLQGTTETQILFSRVTWRNLDTITGTDTALRK